MNQQEQQAFLLSTFREEVDGHIVSLTRALVALEDESEPEQFSSQLQDLMRVLHTIKGAARMLGFGDITRVAHAMEELVGTYRTATEAPTREAIDALFEGIDTVAELTRVVTRRSGSEGVVPASPLTEPNQLTALITHLQTLAGPSTSVVPEVRPTLEAMMQTLAQPTLSPEPLTPVRDETRRADVKIDETIRVRLDKLDGLINAAGELVINKMKNDEHLQVIQTLVNLDRQRSRLSNQLREILVQHMPPQERNQLLGMTELFSFPDEKAAALNFPAQLTLVQTITRSGMLDSQAIGQIYQKLEEIIELDRKIEQIGQETLRERKAYNLRYEALADEMRSSMLDLRMLPLDTIFSRFNRPVRDLANERGKQVRLLVTGGTIELDKRVLEEISDPLVQLLRNAVDHGIESPQKRELLGKPVEGVIKLTAFQKGNQVVIQVEDDGQGLDPILIRQAAVLKNVLTPAQSDNLSDQSILDLIFQPGFSTRTTSDEISGRGFGMDIVQQNVKRLNGRVSVFSKPGSGTLFSLEIPLTLATLEALVVQTAGQLFAFPSTMVSSIQSVPKNTIETLEGQSVMRFQGQIIPMVALAELLGLNKAAPSSLQDNRFSFNYNLEEAELAVIIKVGGGRDTLLNTGGSEQSVAFLVDALLDEREIVVKSMGSFLSNVPNVAGATVMGSDELAIILDVYSLFQTVRLGQNYTRPVAPSKDQVDYWTLRPVSRLLVVDDSLATRELERSILEAAGYQVETARDGLEALQMCREHPFDLVLTDVEMPNMDGFRLTGAIHQDARLHDLPVIIISSRDSETDRRKGLEAGAQAYIVKNQFEQNRLLETIAKLIDA